MDLPELRAIVATFLSTPNLVVAALVCKSWNASFTPVLYSVLTWSYHAKNPSKEGIMANAKLIRELYISAGINMVRADFWYANKQLRFPAVRTLHLTGSQNCPVEHQVKIIRKCTELKELNWDIQHGDSQKASLDVSNLFKAHCSSVERLRMRLHSHSVTDEDLSQILDDCRKITEFAIVCQFGYGFGKLAFESLTRHFEHVQRLDLSKSHLSSGMAQQILTNCPHLTAFMGERLEARDILGIFPEDKAMMGDKTTMDQQPPQDWVCTKLRTLNIFICGLEDKPQEWHRGVFRQLSKMERLMHLIISPVGVFAEKSRDGLDLKVEAGLDLLSSLKELHKLGFEGSWQQMEERDVKWMMEAWPMLKFVEGTLHPNKPSRENLERILKVRKVSVY